MMKSLESSSLSLSLWRVPIILRAHFMIFILCLKTWGVLLFVHLKNVISRVHNYV